MFEITCLAPSPLCLRPLGHYTSPRYGESRRFLCSGDAVFTSSFPILWLRRHVPLPRSYWLFTTSHHSLPCAGLFNLEPSRFPLLLCFARTALPFLELMTEAFFLIYDTTTTFSLSFICRSVALVSVICIFSQFSLQYSTMLSILNLGTRP